MMKYRATYTVSGFGDFPEDMLRYDGARPVDATAAAAMEGTAPRSVRLFGGHPTAARWESFGWSVTFHAGRWFLDLNSDAVNSAIFRRRQSEHGRRHTWEQRMVLNGMRAGGELGQFLESSPPRLVKATGPHKLMAIGWDTVGRLVATGAIRPVGARPGRYAAEWVLA